MFVTLSALVLFLFPLAYSPGPGNLFFAANGARFGFGATIPATTGYHLATWVGTLAIGLGLAVVLERFAQVFVVVQYAGGAYVLWLAWKFLRAGSLRGGTDARPAGFWDGVVLFALNPKAYVIIMLMFSQFLDAFDGPQLGIVVLITTVFTLNNLIAFSLWTLAGDGIAVLFRTPQRAAALNVVFGLLLAGVAIWMLLV